MMPTKQIQSYAQGTKRILLATISATIFLVAFTPMLWLHFHLDGEVTNSHILPTAADFVMARAAARMPRRHKSQIKGIMKKSEVSEQAVSGSDEKERRAKLDTSESSKLKMHPNDSSAHDSPAEDRLKQFVSSATSVDTTLWPSIDTTHRTTSDVNMIQTYVISLPKRNDRRQRFAANAPAVLREVDGMSHIKWWPAVPSTKIPPDLLWLNQNETSPDFWSEPPGKIGSSQYATSSAQYACLLSHVSLWRHHALNNPSDNLLVLEDDTRIPVDFAEQLASFIKGLPREWEVLHLGSDAVWSAPIALTRRYIEGGKMSRTWGYVFRGGDFNVAARAAKAANEVNCRLPVDVMLTAWYGTANKPGLFRAFAPPMPLLRGSSCDGGDIIDVAKGQSSKCGNTTYNNLDETEFKKRREHVWFSFCGNALYKKKVEEVPLAPGWENVKVTAAEATLCEASRCTFDLIGEKSHTMLFTCYGIRSATDAFEEVAFRGS